MLGSPLTMHSDDIWGCSHPCRFISALLEACLVPELGWPLKSGGWPGSDHSFPPCGFSTWLAWSPSRSQGSRTSHMVAGFSWDRCSKTPKLKLQGCSDLLSGVIQHLYHHLLLVKREPEPAWVPGQRTTKAHGSWEERGSLGYPLWVQLP